MTRLRNGGFGLLELLTVTSILAVLASIALVSWMDAVHRIRVDTAITRFTTSLWHARSEAIRRGAWLVVERLDDCPTRNWSCGWLTYEDLNNNALLDKEDKVIQTTAALPGVHIRVNANSLRHRIRLAPNGTSHAVSAGSFFFEHIDSATCARLLFSSGLRWRREGCA
jgi:type IV fimbrial biogenesis protein FimT